MNGLAQISRHLAERCEHIDASAVADYTYNPLVYARAPHELYLKRYGSGKKQAIWLGMNPGPFGMAQTGVPFGDVSMVQNFLGVTGKVGKPPSEHPKRPVEGFACKKSEVSGSRLWGYMKSRYESADAMAERFFVVNYCPLAFMTESGSNLTPDKLPRNLQAEIESVCDEALRSIVTELAPEWVIGVGAFAQKRAQLALAGTKVRIGTVLHPSPASPHANRGWAAAVQKQLDALGLG